MKISLDWIKEYTKVRISTEELLEKLTMQSVEVKEVVQYGQHWEGIIVGEVMNVLPHPAADKIRMAKVDTGLKILDIVCGGKNLERGQKVALALPGVVLPNGMKISKAIIRGRESEGMICSAEELGLMKEGEREILVLDDSAKPGIPLIKALQLDAPVLTLDVLPNRPDLMSHQGVAREIAALTQSTYEADEYRLPKKERKQLPLEIDIKQPPLCPRYSALLIDNLRIEASPAWMQNRLRAIGLRPVNNIVDITNYLMADMGFPMHAFDYDAISGGKYTLRTSRAGETVRTLDGVERTLPEGILLAQDAQQNIDLCGIMGGESAKIKPTTNRIVLQCAVFEALHIRKSSRLLNHRTDAVGVYEKGVDQERVMEVLAKAFALLQEQQENIVLDRIIDIQNKKEKRLPIIFAYKQYQRLIGQEITEKEATEKLTRLGCVVVDVLKAGLKIIPPSFRLDLKLPEDIVEELARLYGYDRIPAELPEITLAQSKTHETIEWIKKIQNVLTSLGWQEIISYSFIGPENIKKLQLNKTLHIPLENPLSSEHSFLRTEMLSNLVFILEQNAPMSEDLRFFEVGKVFVAPQEKSEGIPQESIRITGVMSNEEVDFFTMKGVLEHLLRVLHITGVSYESTIVPYAKRGQVVNIIFEKTSIGTLGVMDKKYFKAKNKKRNVVWFDIGLGGLMRTSRVMPMYKQIDVYPAVLFDLAILVDKNVSWQEIEATIFSQAQGLVQTVELFDVYEGEQVPAGKRSIAFHLAYQSLEKTLTQAEVEPVHKAILIALSQNHGAQVREVSLKL